VAVAPTVKAVESKPAEKAESAVSTLVATVNIEDARIMSQDKNLFNIAFTLSNREGLQTGVKYGVQLVADGAKYISDEKVYDDSVTLYENSNVKKEIVYEAPKTLSGNYTLYLVSNNESNFPFGVTVLGKAKLAATEKGVQILNDSCFLQVADEKAQTHYTISQNVDISATESLKLTCTAVNSTDKAVTLTPYFETRYFGPFGKIAPQDGGSYAAVTLAKGEKKSFTTLLPKGAMPQFYNLKVSLMSSDLSSNKVSVSYIIRGVSASIQKISLDKDYYNMGEKGEMSILWQSSAGNFLRSKVAGASVPPVVTIKATIKNENDRECAAFVNQTLVRNAKDPQSKISFTSKSACTNPKVVATLTDDKGNTLDQKEFAFESDPQNIKPLKSSSIIIMVVALLAIIGLGIYMKKKKNNNEQA
jgi:hypothetical protein